MLGLVPILCEDGQEHDCKSVKKRSFFRTEKRNGGKKECFSYSAEWFRCYDSKSKKRKKCFFRTLRKGLDVTNGCCLRIMYLLPKDGLDQLLEEDASVHGWLLVPRFPSRASCSSVSHPEQVETKRRSM